MALAPIDSPATEDFLHWSACMMTVQLELCLCINISPFKQDEVVVSAFLVTGCG